MDELDTIILIGLRDLGCPIDDDIKSLGQFDTDLVYTSIIYYIRRIDETKASGLSENLPGNMSGKVNTCTKTVAVIKELGWRGELGFHQLMYPNESDIRKLFTFLSQALPSKGVIDDGFQEGRGHLSDTIHQVLTPAIEQTWTPHYCPQVHNFNHIYPLGTWKLTTPNRGRAVATIPGLENYYVRHLPFVSAQPQKREDVAPSVFETNSSAYYEALEREAEWNAHGLESGLNPQAYRKQKLANITGSMASLVGSAYQSALAQSGSRSLGDTISQLQQGSSKVGGRFDRQRRLGHDESDVLQPAVKETQEERDKKQAAEIAELDETLSEAQRKLEALQKQMQLWSDTIRQNEARINEEAILKANLTREYKVEKETWDLMADYEKNVSDLRKLSSVNASKSIELATEWEKHRIPLIEQYRALKDAEKNSADEIKVKLEKIKEMRAKMKELIAEIHAKDEQYKNTLETWEALPKDVSRSVYTKRILEIVKNVKKQKVDIDKILIDTRSLRKEINTVTETLNRTFALTDELVFQDAKKDPIAKQSYKYLVEMNEKFQKLTATIEETGATRNNILNLETRIEQISSRTSSLNVDRIAADLKEMKDENGKTIAQIKKLAGK